jgi:hypothetical protein
METRTIGGQVSLGTRRPLASEYNRSRLDQGIEPRGGTMGKAETQ